MNTKLDFINVEFPIEYDLKLKASILHLIKDIKTKNQSVNFISVNLQIKLNNSTYLSIAPKWPLNISSLVEIDNYLDNARNRFNTYKEYYSISNGQSMLFSYVIITEKDYALAINAIKYIKSTLNGISQNYTSTEGNKSIRGPQNLPLNTDYKSWGDYLNISNNNIHVKFTENQVDFDTLEIKNNNQDNLASIKFLGKHSYYSSITDTVINASKNEFIRNQYTRSYYVKDGKVKFIFRDKDTVNHMMSLVRTQTATILPLIIDIEYILNEIHNIEGNLLHLDYTKGVNLSYLQQYPKNLIATFLGDICCLTTYKTLFDSKVGYYKAAITATSNNPVISINSSKRKWIGWYYSEELKNAINLGYKFKILGGYMYEPGINK